MNYDLGNNDVEFDPNHDLNDSDEGGYLSRMQWDCGAPCMLLF